MSDIISKIPSSMLVNDTADAAQVNKALLNQVQGSNKIIDAVNTVNAAVTAIGSGIVELGTNSNGTYIKWGNGLMVVFKDNVTISGAVNSTTARFDTSGTTYYVYEDVTFPASFYFVPTVVPISYGVFVAIAGPGYITTTTVSLYVFSGVNSPSGTNMGYVAIGFYK